MRNAFTQAELIAILDYNPSTGRFMWRASLRTAGFYSGNQKYWSIGIKGETYKASHVAWFYMTGKWPTHTIDHINGRSLDDRFENLREATYRENNSNMARHRAGYLVGATFDKAVVGPNPWLARIKINGKDKWLGYFHTQGDAHKAYVAAKQGLGL